MTPADELHAAADKLRTTARDAERESPSPWRLDRDVVRCNDGGIVADASGEPNHAGDLPYIAAMHPGVGAALADWLDAAAVHVRAGYVCCDNGAHRCYESATPQALAVARQILGSQP
ncbi:hypothetical protein [Streptomyces virginiae]|uniref:hypothetical protein n=1 Tax=Streptomyces virginiae TaxID=1961 RepID=UPI00369E795E